MAGHASPPSGHDKNKTTGNADETKKPSAWTDGLSEKKNGEKSLISWKMTKNAPGTPDINQKKEKKKTPQMFGYLK